MSKHDDEPRPACDGHFLLFWSRDRDDHLQAAEMCAECPLFADCLAKSPERADCFEGTWAGRWYVNGKPRNPKRRRRTAKVAS